MDKQMTISAFSDELAQVRTKKKEFLSQIERIVPWGEWLAMIQPCYLDPPECECKVKSFH